MWRHSVRLVQGWWSSLLLPSAWRDWSMLGSAGAALYASCMTGSLPSKGRWCHRAESAGDARPELLLLRCACNREG
jgi:hypothetical protein